MTPAELAALVPSWEIHLRAERKTDGTLRTYLAGVRPFLMDALAEQARSLFELKDGKPVAKPGITNPRDPCSDFTVLDWLADLHATDDNLLWEKRK